MAEGQLQYTGIERRRAPRVVSSHVALCWAFAALEGTVAALCMLVPALVYHAVFLHRPLGELPFELYGVYSALAGVLYGGFAAAGAARFLSRPRRPKVPLFDAALSWTAAFAMGLFGAFLLGLAGDLSRVSLLSAYVLGLPVLLFVRAGLYAGVAARIREGRLQYQKVAVIGDRADVVRFLYNGNLWKAGYLLSSTLYLEEARNEDGSLRAGAVVEFAQRWVAQGAEFIVFVGELNDLDRLEAVTNELKRFSINVACAPATGNTSIRFLDVVPIGRNNAVRLLSKPMGDAAVLMKRGFDLFGAGVGLALLSPLFAIVALLIRLEGPGPVFFRQERRGFNGETFFIWKFRSMRVTEDGHSMVQATLNDDRVTRIGRFIRRTSIDELPQLINVLHGEMSLVGPRPHAVVHDDELGEQLASYAHRQRLKPGITGWAQVNGYRGPTKTMTQVEGRTAHDLYYIDNWSIFLDCWIIVLTLLSPKTRQNAA